jgi:hypothetical protein
MRRRYRHWSDFIRQLEAITDRPIVFNRKKDWQKQIALATFIMDGTPAEAMSRMVRLHNHALLLF